MPGQKTHPVAISVRSLARGGLSRREVARIAGRILCHEKKSRIAELAVVFVGDRRMQTLNARWRGKNKTTDVLSFGYSTKPVVGDIFISVPQARRQAIYMNHSARREMQELVTHGILHLLGHDHKRPRDAKKMRIAHEAIMRRLRAESC